MSENTIRCQNCGWWNPDKNVTCEKCNVALVKEHVVEIMDTKNAADQDLRGQLEQELERYLAVKSHDGWEIVNRSATTAQLKKKGSVNVGLGLLTVFVNLLLGVFIDPCFWGIALGCLLLIGIAALTRKEQLEYVNEDILVGNLRKRKVTTER